MGEIFERAIAALNTLAPEDRERLAWEIIERVESKTEWDGLIKAPRAQAWLRKSAKKALKSYEKIHRSISQTFISVPSENLLREGSYWGQFDDLPADIRKLAESNYHLWKDSPGHPGLRFKQILDDPKVFSFRVGLRHRTVGVETGDGRIVWFWVGSLDAFRALTA